MVRLCGLVRGGLASSQFVIVSVVWASLRAAMVLSGLISKDPGKNKISIKTGTGRPSNEPVCAIPRGWAYARASRTSLNMRFTVGKAKYP